MSFEVVYLPEVLDDDVSEIPRNLYDRIARAILDRLAVAPTRYGRRLGRSLAGLWRIRVGDYRVAYTVNEKARRVTVWAVRHRKNIYRTLGTRWKRGTRR